MEFSESKQPLDNASSLAEYLRVSVAHIRKLTREKLVPVVHIGRRAVRFDRDMVLRALRDTTNAGE
jgi:excisionase family DNA binding protein